MIVWLRLALAAVLFALNTLVHVPVLFAAVLLKAILRGPRARRFCDRVLMGIAESWIGFNTWLIRALTGTRIVIDSQAAALRPDGHYLVLANHQSWVDVPILQAVFNRRIPLLRFFLKSQLFWVPLLGQAWWALDFPFMKRYSRAQLARNPALAGRDVEATRLACEKYRGVPVSVMSFAEGTRFTAAKHRQQQSPYLYLLKPRAGGVAYVLNAMGDALHGILDVTIAYPHGRPSFADLFANRIPEVRVHIVERAIPSDLVGSDYQNDSAVRERAQAWINELWGEKDMRSSKMHAREPRPAFLSSRS